ncbi:TetR family transcriptional regulator [Leptospira kobayashii]|uniref:TetR family transcriptional regulator n=1 Tax=Leptospira kobayashii TaxID=1917830 RepID=A0ABM7UFL2_9LEPT|nr:TetR/AcrR family transcriptional regulator [Leptospira kobayashii]BDA77183.1 TetR family transcriptional regulator [Leptospira kobayashii]
MGRVKCFERTDILDKAIQLFWRKGYADTSLSDLEKATGVNKSGLYSEFKDKDDFFCETLKRFSQSNCYLENLSREPLGWKNIEFFLKSKLTNKGQKGCYFSNTIREYSIIPEEAKRFMEQTQLGVRNAMIENIQATGTEKNPEVLTDMILTFHMGVNLKLNAVEPALLEGEIDTFLAIIK